MVEVVADQGKPLFPVCTPSVKDHTPVRPWLASARARDGEGGGCAGGSAAIARAFTSTRGSAFRGSRGVQVAVGLSHAAILEESVRARDLLMQQNVALDHARAEAEKAIRARNDFLAVMNHEMRTPMHAIIALSTLLQVRTLLYSWSPVLG